MDTSKEGVKAKSYTLPIILIICIITLLSGVFLSVIYIIQNYQRLGEELKLERTVYINELSQQISAAVYQRRDRLLDQTSDSASMLDFAGAESYEDIRQLYKNKIDSNYTLILCDDQGKCFDMYGNPFPIQNNRRLSGTLDCGNPEYFLKRQPMGLITGCLPAPLSHSRSEIIGL